MMETQQLGGIESAESVEEFSSFDISDQGSIEEHSHTDQGHFYKSDEDYPSIDRLSTPKKKPLISNDRNSDIGTMCTKPSSRLSSDTFDTPKTVETRASTMTSNTVFYHKPINTQLKLSDATMEINKPTILQTKRLSRCSDIDVSFDKIVDSDNLRTHTSLNDLFSTLSLCESNTPCINNLSELQKQIIDYKVQIKLLQGLMRETFLGAETINNVNADSSETQILERIDSSMYDNHSRILNEENEGLKNSLDEMKNDYEELLHSYETLKDKYSEYMNNEHEWHNIVVNALYKFESSPKRDKTFNDILHTLLTHVETLIENYNTLKNDMDNSSQAKSEITELSNLLKENEFARQEMKIKVEALERENHSMKVRIEELGLENASLISDLKYFRDREVKHDGMIKRLKEMELNNTHLMNANDKLSQEATKEARKIAILINMMASYHSVILKLLTSVIDPKTCGNIIKVCKSLNANLSFDEVTKILTVTHNYEIESLSTILQSYEKLMNEKKNAKFSQQQVLDLRNQINTLNEKIHNLEKINETETTRVQELERQNAHFQKLSSDFTSESERLEKLRLEDLNNKWKAAEEALSQYKKGAKKKVAELEEEIRNLRANNVK